MSASDRYDIAEELLKSVTRSKVRSKIILCLKDGAKSTNDLQIEMGIRNTTILHAISKMTDLVIRADKGYELTNLGNIQAYMLDEMVDFVLTLEEHRDFWQTHDISSILIELLKKIGMLAQSEVVRDEPGAPLRSLEYFVNEMMKSNQIYVVYPIIAPGFSEAIANPVKRGAKGEMILTKQALDATLNDHEVLIEDLLVYQNFTLCITKWARRDSIYSH